MAKSFFGLFRAPGKEDPLASAKAMRAWAATLPTNDPMGAVTAMAHLIEESSTKLPAVTANSVLAMLELDRLSLPLMAQLQAQYRSLVLSDEVRRNLWHARNDLARWLAYAYEQFCEGARGGSGDAKVREQLHGVYSRLFHYRGVQATQGLFHYQQLIPARWKIAHDAYKDATVQGVATQPFALVERPQPGERLSAEQEYLHFLILQRLNTGNLSVQQIELTSQWLREWVPSLKLAKDQPVGDQYWSLDLERFGGLFSPSPEPQAGEVLYLDITPLRAQLTALMTSIAQQLVPGAAKAGMREIKDQLALAKRLELLWQPNAQPQARRGERHAEKRAVLVAPGWAEIAILLREVRPWRPHDPYKYTYDAAAELVTLGRPPTPKNPSSSIKDNLPPDRRGWEVLDTSESGCRIQSTTQQASRLQIGSLLALQLEGDTRWQIGIVRRLKRRTAEHTELGIETIAERGHLVMPQPIIAGDSGYSVDGVDVNANGKPFDALYVPPQERPHAAPVRSLVVPAAEFAPGRALSLNVENKTQQIRLALTIEQAKDWVWTTFEVVGTAQ